MSKQWEVLLRVKQSKVDGKLTPSKAHIKSVVERAIIEPELLPIVKDTLSVVNKTSGGARAKGSGSDFERKIAKSLGQWWWNQDFRRTPNSGGWDKQADDGKVEAAGDLFAPPEAEFPFCVECKHRKDALNLFTKKNDSSDCIYDWWEQAEGDSRMSNKSSILVMGCKRIEYIGITLKSLTLLHCNVDVQELQFIKLTPPEQQPFLLMLYKDFLENFRRTNGEEDTAREAGATETC